MIFMAGASALMVGNYLTTLNQPVEKISRCSKTSASTRTGTATVSAIRGTRLRLWEKGYEMETAMA